MIEVRVKNYESISNTKLCVDGFTSLVGTNYLGKSSILRAINAALTNQQGKEFIRWGEKFCEVSIKTDKVDILWHKENGNNFYKVNGNLYEKIGKDEPPDPIQEAGFKILKIDREKINLNYAQQFFPLFLVDKLDSKTADLLASIYGLDRLYKAIDICNDEQRDNKNLLNYRKKDLELAEESLEKFRGFEDIENSIKKIKKDKSYIEEKEKNAEKLKKFKEDLDTLSKSCKKLKPIEGINVPEAEDLKENISYIKKAQEYYEKLNLIKKKIKKLQRIENLKDLPNLVDLKLKIEKHTNLKENINTLKALSTQVKKLQIVKSLVLPKELIGTGELKKIQRFRIDLIKYKEILINLKSDLDILKSKKDEIEEKQKEYDICPLCGSDWKK